MGAEDIDVCQECPELYDDSSEDEDYSIYSKAKSVYEEEIQHAVNMSLYQGTGSIVDFDRYIDSRRKKYDRYDYRYNFW